LNKRPIVAVDAGSAQTRVLAAEEVDGRLVFRAWGISESKGWKKGGIINLEAVEASIRKAVEAAEAMLGAPIERAVLGLGASQVKGLNAHGGINISSRHREIQREDQRKAVDEVRRQVTMLPDRVVLHVIPKEYTLDSFEGIRDPVGMMGGRLEVNIHVISAAQSGQMNLVTAANHAGLIVEETAYEALAAAEAALNTDERELGVVLADIGAGSTEVIAFQHGSLQHSFTVPVGGDHFTNDIAVGLRTPIPEAERIKCGFGVAMATLAGPSVSIEVPRVGDRPLRLVPQQELGEILQPRAQELLELIYDELHRAGLDRQTAAGIVFTGGGAKLAGLCDLAEQQLNLTARIGLPSALEGAPENICLPVYTTLVGLLYYAQRLRQVRQSKDENWLDKFKKHLTGGWN